MPRTPRRFRHIVVLPPLLLGLACGRDATSPLIPIRGPAAHEEIDVPLDAGNLKVDLTYNGQDVTAYGTDACPFWLTAQRGASHASIAFCAPQMSPQTLTNLAPGTHDMILRWTMASSVVLHGPEPVAITAATVTNRSIDVSQSVGIVTGLLTINGAFPNNTSLCLRTPLPPESPMPAPPSSSILCKHFSQPSPPPPNVDGSFKLFVPPGAGRGELRAMNGSLLHEFNYTGIAGETVDLGNVAVEIGDLRIAVTYLGQDVTSYATDACPFWANAQRGASFASTSFCAPQMSPQTIANLAPGAHDVSLRWTMASNVILYPPEPVTIVGDAVTDKVFDVSSKVGIVAGQLTVNGEQPGNATLCLRTPLPPVNPMPAPPASAIICKFFAGNLPGPEQDGRFKLFVPPGAGRGEVRGMNGGLLLEFDYTGVAGQTVDLGVVAAGVGDLRMTIMYKGQDVTTYGTDACPFWATAQRGSNFASLAFCAPQMSPQTLTNLMPGSHDLSLRWTMASSVTLLGPEAVTIVAGEVTNKTLDVSDKVAIVSGNLTINGQPPVNVSLCLRTPLPPANPIPVPPSSASICKFYFAPHPLEPPRSDGRFKFFVPAGCGRGDVRAMNGSLVGEFSFCVNEGDDVDIGDPLGNRAPTITSIGGPYSGAEGSSIQFTASASDLDGDLLTYHWDFGDGATGTGASIGHVYADNGSYSAKLTVRDARDATAEASVSVAVTNVAPVVMMPAAAVLIQGETFAGDGSFVDPGADSWSATVSYAGEPAGMLALSMTSFALEHKYVAPGSFIATVRITDDDGGVGVGTVSVRVWSYVEALDDAGDYVREHLGGQEIRPLLASLEAAAAAIERGNIHVAISDLRVYLKKLEVFVASGKVSVEDGEVLANKIHRILSVIQ